MTKFLPRNSQNNEPMWTDTKEGYLIKFDKSEILIPKVRKTAKKATVILKDGPIAEFKKENWDKIIEYCRFLVKLKRKAGKFPILEIKIDTPDKGRYFISDSSFGFKWLTDTDGNLV